MRPSDSSRFCAQESPSPLEPRRGAAGLAACLAAALAAGLALGAAPGCGGVARSDRIRTALVGLDARELPVCLGPPLRRSVEGELERFTYLWELEPGMGLGTGAMGHRLAAPSDEHSLPEDLDDVTRNFCRAEFELRARRVRAVDVVGRTPDGLNADYRCVLALERCVALPD